jgi:hypothetical protein
MLILKELRCTKIVQDRRDSLVNPEKKDHD